MQWADAPKLQPVSGAIANNLSGFDSDDDGVSHLSSLHQEVLSRRQAAIMVAFGARASMPRTTAEFLPVVIWRNKVDTIPLSIANLSASPSSLALCELG